ncbi:DNA-binding transcriptional LysR family regulator [Lactobacillus colini]|uniref:DNA-binding transcriptional LysR family regulator n=1 Tax=Lactobacillus colini TaxID=1819254 RepID=A0ABS4MFA1_9LACO|nr:LysR substrate-binding domain-containing protein [Lactobacillus colini]MBP2058359.1 DNA-binding transcriptional LysR family regulator [Lactobacillus colini]
MNIQDFKYYHELVNQKSYTKTAKKFGVSQPTITAAIKRLENSFNAKFLIRDQSHKSIIITKVGMQFDEHVQSILNEINVAETEIRQSTGAEISFGLPPIIGRNYFPSLVSELLDAGILRHLNVVERGSYDLEQMLQSGSVNIALLGQTSTSSTSADIDFHLIKRFPMKIIVAKDNPLAQKDAIYFKELANENFIGLNSDYIHTRALDYLLDKNKISLNTIYRSPDVLVVKDLVAKNIGFSYLTSLSIRPSDNVVSIPLKDDNQPEFILVAAKRKSYLMTEQEKNLWNILTQH